MIIGWKKENLARGGFLLAGRKSLPQLVTSTYINDLGALFTEIVRQVSVLRLDH